MIGRPKFGQASFRFELIGEVTRETITTVVPSVRFRQWLNWIALRLILLNKYVITRQNPTLALSSSLHARRNSVRSFG